MTRLLFTAALGASVTAGIVAGVTFVRPTVPTAAPETSVRGVEETKYRTRVRELLDECRSASVLFTRKPTHDMVVAKCATISERHSRIPTVIPDGIPANPEELTAKISSLDSWGRLALFASENFLSPHSPIQTPSAGWKELEDISKSLAKKVAEVEALIGK